MVNGLSPRVRGNRGSARHHQRGQGSIPACAGEPVPYIAGDMLDRVYPRVCGGTRRGRVVDPHVVGLSPRVRGNRLRPLPRFGHDRSIPACAGEPASAASGGGE